MTVNNQSFQHFTYQIEEAKVEESQELELVNPRYAMLDQLFDVQAAGLPAIFGNDDSLDTFLKEADDSSISWLEHRLNVITECIEKIKTPEEFLEAFNQEIDSLQQCYNENMANALTETAKLEGTYRGIESMFLNAGELEEPVDFLDLDLTELMDPDATSYYTMLVKIINYASRQHRLSNSYSHLGLPGFIGKGLSPISTKSAFTKISKVCNKNRTMLLTDFRKDLPDESMLFSAFKEANLTDKNPYAKHVVITTEQLVAREMDSMVEKQPVLSSAALSLLGLILNYPSHKTPAGDINGVLAGARGSQYSMDEEEEVLAIRNLGSVPLILSGPKVLFYGHRTTYTGSQDSWKIFPIVATADMIFRNIKDWLHRLRYIDLNPDVKQEIEAMSRAYLDSLKSDHIIGDFAIDKFHQQGDKLDLKYTIKPIYPLGDFQLEIEVTKNIDPNVEGKNANKVEVS